MYMRSSSQFTNTLPQEEYHDLFDPKIFLQPGLTEQDIIQIREVFLSFDFDEDGFLCPLDIRSALTKYGYSAKKDTIHHLLGEYDHEMEGAIDFKAFVAMCAKNHEQEQVSKNEIRNLYLKYDKNKKGYFDINDLKKVSKELGENVDDETLEEMIRSIDSNMDGNVTFEDFYNAMTKNIK